MNDKIAEIKKKLQEVVAANPNYPIVGKVAAVDGETCSVKLVSGLVLSDVKISASVTESNDYLLLEPVVGSDVLMLSGDGTLSNLYLIKVDQVAKFKFSQNGLKVEFDSTDKKVKIDNGDMSLKTIFDDLTSLLKLFKVFTPVGPSGTPLPDTITAINQLKTNVGKILK